MTNEPDYYVILGVAEDATAAEVRRAYRHAARAHHPDLNPGDDGATARFKAIQRAYDVLSDPASRDAYRRPRPQPPGPASSAPGGSYAAAWGMAPDRSAGLAPSTLSPEVVEALLLLRAVIRRAEIERRFRRLLRVVETW